MRNLLAGFIVGAAVLGPPCVEARTWTEIRDSGELRICTAGSSAAFYQANAEAFARYLDVRARVTQLANWDQQFHDRSGATVKEARYEAHLLADGRCDLYPNDLHITDWRQTKMLLVPYYKTRKMIVAHRELRNVLKREADLAGRRAAVQKGTAYEAWLHAQNASRFKNDPVRVELAPTDESMQRVAGHLADFTVIGAEGAFKWVRGDLANLDMHFPVDDLVSVGWGLPVAATDLRSRLEAFFADGFHAGSELDRAWQRHYGISLLEYHLFESSLDSSEAERKALLTWFVPLMAGLGGMVLAMLFWTRRLRREVAGHRIIADNTFDWETWQAPAAGRFLYVSPSCEAITGYAADEFKADPGLMLRIIHPADRHLYASHLHNIENKGLCEVEFRIQTKAGDTRWIAHGCRPVHDSHGSYLGRRASNRDVTAAKEAEMQYRTIVQTAQDGYLVVAQDTHFVDTNDAYCRMLGYHRDELLALKVADVEADEDPEEIRRHSDAIRRTGHAQFESRHRRKDGTLIDVEVTVQYLDLYGGVMITFIRDITGRKAIERQLAEERQRLKESKERLEAAASAGIVGIWDWDLVNNRLAWDKVIYRLYGLDEADWGGVYEGPAWGGACDVCARTIHPEDRAYVEGEIQAALRGESEYAPEFRVVWPDGSVHHIKAMSRMTFDEAGKPLRMVGVNYDVTEQKNVEAMLERGIAERTHELRKARDAAESANVAKSAFLANISHEMRTPLHHILGMTHLIRREPLTPKQADRMETLETATRRLTAIIDTILDLTRIEADQFELVEQPFSPRELLDEVLASVQAQAAAKHLHLDASVADLPATLVGDKGHLRQALLNYVGNAIRFTETGTIAVRLNPAAELGDFVLVRFEVEDSGPGVDPQDVPRLFSIFEQVDNSAGRQFGGLGMGLAMTRKIAEIMGGEAGCDSRPGAGSTFWFTVRLKKA